MTRHAPDWYRAARLRHLGPARSEVRLAGHPWRGPHTVAAIAEAMRRAGLAVATVNGQCYTACGLAYAPTLSGAIAGLTSARRWPGANAVRP